MVVLVLVLGTVAVVGLRRSHRTTPLTPGQAIERYRSDEKAESSEATAQGRTVGSTDAPPATSVDAERAQRGGATSASQTPSTSSPRSEPGVYVYESSGWSRTDALGGARHDYPPEMSVTITSRRCEGGSDGARYRWDFIEERWDEFETCIEGDREYLRTATIYREFFGRGREIQFRCTQDSPARPPSLEVGTTWTAVCDSESDNLQSSTKGRVLGRGSISMEGRRIDAIHYVVETKVTGDSRGSGRREIWASAAHGLALRVRGSGEGTGSYGPVEVNYAEEYELRLKSLKPSR